MWRKAHKGHARHPHSFARAPTAAPNPPRAEASNPHPTHPPHTTLTKFDSKTLSPPTQIHLAHLLAHRDQIIPESLSRQLPLSFRVGDEEASGGWGHPGPLQSDERRVHAVRAGAEDHPGEALLLGRLRVAGWVGVGGGGWVGVGRGG